MKNTVIAAAIATITHTVSALESAAECEGSTNWRERYYQEVNDHRDNLSNAHSGVNALRVELEAAQDSLKTRTEAMKGWQQTAAEWERRFRALTHDMDGTQRTADRLVSEYNELKAQLALKTKAADRLGRLHDELIQERDALQDAVNDAGRMVTARDELIRAQRAVIADMKAS